jgi:hypothetical protein
LTARDFAGGGGSPGRGKRRRQASLVDDASAKKGSPPRHVLRSSNGINLVGGNASVTTTGTGNARNNNNNTTPVKNNGLRRRKGHPGNQTPKDNDLPFGIGIELQSPTDRRHSFYQAKPRSPLTKSSNGNNKSNSPRDSAPVISGVALPDSAARRVMRRPVPPLVYPHMCHYSILLIYMLLFV